MERIEARIGDGLLGDCWADGIAEALRKGDAYVDQSFKGCQFRVALGGSSSPVLQAVNIRFTGRPRFINGGWQSRVKIEYVQDGEPSIFDGGWLFHNFK